MSTNTIPIKETSKDAKALIKKLDYLIGFYTIKQRRLQRSTLFAQESRLIEIKTKLVSAKKALQELTNTIEP